jgi:chromosomal replication initiation ATPase DnaA
MPDATVWDEVLAHVRVGLDAEDFRRWFGATTYASDAGDQITVWVASEAIRRHLLTHFGRKIQEALAAIGRAGTHVRFVVAEFDDEDEDKAES